jgi:hypothetical protein
MSVPREEKIRAIAHRIWEEAGRPSDQADLHWEMAEKEVDEAERAQEAHLGGTDELPVLKNKPVV